MLNFFNKKILSHSNSYHMNDVENGFWKMVRKRKEVKLRKYSSVLIVLCTVEAHKNKTKQLGHPQFNRNDVRARIKPSIFGVQRNGGTCVHGLFLSQTFRTRHRQMPDQKRLKLQSVIAPRARRGKRRRNCGSIRALNFHQLENTKATLDGINIRTITCNFVELGKWPRHSLQYVWKLTITAAPPRNCFVSELLFLNTLEESMYRRKGINLFLEFFVPSRFESVKR